MKGRTTNNIGEGGAAYKDSNGRQVTVGDEVEFAYRITRESDLVVGRGCILSFTPDPACMMGAFVEASESVPSIGMGGVVEPNSKPWFPMDPKLKQFYQSGDGNYVVVTGRRKEVSSEVRTGGE